MSVAKTLFVDALMLQDELSCYLGGSDPVNCALDQLVAGARGEAVLGVLLGGGLMLGFYKASNGSLAASSVLVAMIGPILLAFLPSNLSTVAVTIMFLGLVGGGLALANKYVMSEGI